MGQYRAVRHSLVNATVYMVRPYITQYLGSVMEGMLFLKKVIASLLMCISVCPSMDMSDSYAHIDIPAVCCTMYDTGKSLCMCVYLFSRGLVSTVHKFDARVDEINMAFFFT